ncbi:MAG TPA: hypothetical protein VK841_09460 [Polyangiaceae bacterium]|jgi:hypothetical protein|nr:hypothetical protein [Polyangiaceae bacterium]
MISPNQAACHVQVTTLEEWETVWPSGSEADREYARQELTGRTWTYYRASCRHRRARGLTQARLPGERKQSPVKRGAPMGKMGPTVGELASVEDARGADHLPRLGNFPGAKR